MRKTLKAQKQKNKKVRISLKINGKRIPTKTPPFET
jgi:hypothetical protein